VRSKKDILIMRCSIVFIFLATFVLPAFSQGTGAEKGYTYSLKQLIEEAKKNIKKIDEELEKREIEKRNREREAKAREYFEKGKSLYKVGKLKEAKQAWQKTLEITKNPEMKDYIKKSEKKAKREELARKKE